MHQFLTAFFALSSLVLASTFAFSYWQQPLAGDLTRTGFYSERDYNWHLPQIPQTIEATGSAVKQPSFWVLGDSFSVGNQWQSQIAQARKVTFQTFHYDQAGCINDWIALAAKHPTVQTVIVEVVQIGLHIRFANLADCKKMTSKPTETTAHTSSPQTTQQSFQPSRDWRIQHSALTQINTWAVHITNPKSVVGERVVNSPLKPQCAKFSNSRNDRLLYQRDSLDHIQKTAVTYAQAAANLRELQTKIEAHGKQFLLVVVPDKFSAYQSCITDPEVSNGMEAVSTCDFLTPHGITCINLMPLIASKRLSTPDIYMPNDTHFSHAGYRLLAEAVLPHLR